jgi:hypothetical protein
MNRRIDFYDDLQAPAANSLVPSVNVVVVNSEGSVLMIRRTDNGNWAVPGGAVDREVRWVPAPDVLSYTMDRSMRIRVNDFLTPGKTRPSTKPRFALVTALLSAGRHK